MKEILLLNKTNNNIIYVYNFYYMWRTLQSKW